MSSLVAGESWAAVVLRHPLRAFQHQRGIHLADDAFSGVRFRAAGCDAMRGIVEVGHGTWKAAGGGTEGYRNSIAGLVRRW